MRHTEENMQIAAVRWFDYQYAEYSKLLIHPPNGGYRNAAEAARFKAMGTRAGCPDLILLVARNEYNALCVELKTDKGKQTTLQKEWQIAAEKHGNRYVIVRSIEEFIEIIKEYINN